MTDTARLSTVINVLVFKGWTDQQIINWLETWDEEAGTDPLEMVYRGDVADVLDMAQSAELVA